jgi:hypothetical protein
VPLLCPPPKDPYSLAGGPLRSLTGEKEQALPGWGGYGPTHAILCSGTYCGSLLSSNAHFRLGTCLQSPSDQPNWPHAGPQVCKMSAPSPSSRLPDSPLEPGTCCFPTAQPGLPLSSDLPHVTCNLLTAGGGGGETRTGLAQHGVGGKQGTL